MSMKIVVEKYFFKWFRKIVSLKNILKNLRARLRT